MLTGLHNPHIYLLEGVLNARQFVLYQLIPQKGDDLPPPLFQLIRWKVCILLYPVGNRVPVRGSNIQAPSLRLDEGRNFTRDSANVVCLNANRRSLRA